MHPLSDFLAVVKSFVQNIYMEKNFNKRQIWIELVKEIEWNLNREYKMGGTIELIKLKSIVQERKLI